MTNAVRAIFLDDGCAPNDNTVRAVEWQRLIGEFLSPRLGGTPEAWGEANRVVFESQWQRFEAWQDAEPDGADIDFFGAPGERERWMRGMCDHVGIARLSSEQYIALAIETDDYVLPRVRSAFAGAVDAVRWLAERYTLSTASGGTSRELDLYLTGMGVRDLFGERLYGPDLVGAFKGRSEYHRRIFADAGVNPAEALVVDDQPRAVALARDAGARAVLVSSEAHGEETITSLAQLPALLG